MILILFDIDGTLVCTSNRQDSHSFATAYENIYKQPFPTIDWHQYPHVTDTTIIQTVIWNTFKRQADTEEIKTFHNHYIELLSEERKLNPGHYQEVPGAKKIMEWLLDQKDFCIGIATGGWVRPAEIKLGHLVIPFGHFPISGADGQPTREDIIQQALKHAYQLHRQFDRIVYVGDALWDVRTTRNLNMNFVGIRRNNDVEVLKRVGVQHVLQNYLDRDRFLEAIMTAQPPGGIGEERR